MDFHMIHYTQIIWEEVAFIWKATGKAVAIFMTGTVHTHTHTHTHTIHIHTFILAKFKAHPV